MKPFLKWVGGKTQIIDAVMAHVPATMDNYREPFLGGGSVLLSVLEAQRRGDVVIRGRVFASDINPALMGAYANVRDDHRAVETRFAALAADHADADDREAHYYDARRSFNDLDDKTTIEGTALFVFLNKTCFRGMYREGPNGFNVPYGHYKTPPTTPDLGPVADLVRDVVFACEGFDVAIARATRDDYVYLDPPYAPETATSFVGYVRGGFDHGALFAAVGRLDCAFAMSNAKVPLVAEAFAGHDIADVSARRAINSKNPGARTTEVIVASHAMMTSDRSQSQTA